MVSSQSSRRPDLGGRGLRGEPVARLQPSAAHRITVGVAQVVVHLQPQAAFQHRFDKLGQQRPPSRVKATP